MNNRIHKRLRIHDNYIEFRENSLSTNNRFFEVFGYAAFVVEVIMILLYFLSRCTSFPDIRSFYLPLYLSCVLLSFAFLLCNHFCRRMPKVLFCAQSVFQELIMLWSIIFSLYDIHNGYFAFCFVQVMMIFSIGVHLSPFIHCFVNVVNFFLLVFGMTFLKLSPTQFSMEVINIFIFVIISGISIFFSQREYTLLYRNNKNMNIKNRELNYQAYYDGVLNIPNRMAILSELSNRFDQNQPMDIVMVDIDDFKHYNDTYGHMEGDQCLKVVSQYLYDFAKENHGLMGRYGGEEFLMAFPHQTGVAITQLMQKILTIIRTMELQTNCIKEPITISIGICEYQKDTTLENLLLHADQALYHVKNTGKDNFHIYHNRVQ